MNVQFRISFCLQRPLKFLFLVIFVYCSQKYYIFEKKKSIIPSAKTEKALNYSETSQLIVTNNPKRIKGTISNQVGPLTYIQMLFSISALEYTYIHSNSAEMSHKPPFNQLNSLILSVRKEPDCQISKPQVKLLDLDSGR